MTYTLTVYTIIETPLFTEQSSTVWTEAERGEFCAWLAKIRCQALLCLVAAAAARCDGSAPVRGNAVALG